jgi:hypothetical protein
MARGLSPTTRLNLADRPRPPKPPTFAPASATPNLNALAAPPDFGAQASKEVSNVLDPQLKDIAGRYDRQAGGVSDSFGQLTNQYQSRVAAAAAGTRGMFDEAIGPVSAAAKGINAHLTQAGTDAAAKEQTALSASKLPIGAAGPDLPLAAEGAGAGGAAGAIGQNAINSLQAAQKAALTYAGQLPGFAKGEGDQALHQTLSDLAGQMADQLATTTAQAPQLYLQIYNTLLDRAQTDKTFVEQVRQFNVNQKQQARTEKFTEAWGLFQSGAIDAKQFKKMTGVAPSSAPKTVTKLTIVHAADGSTIAVNPYTGETVSTISGPGAPKPQKVTTFKGTDGRTYRYDPKTGSAVLIPGQAGPKTSSKSGISASKAADIAAKAAKDAEDFYHGVTRPNPKDPANPTVVEYTKTYQDAIKTLMQRYPSLGRKRVRQLVNAWYKPGEYGRPKYTGPPASPADVAANDTALQPPAWVTGGQP